MQTRRGFLKMLGVAAVGAAVTPAVLRAVNFPAPKKMVVGLNDLNSYFAGFANRVNADIYRRIWATNPFLELIDGEKRPFVYYQDELERDRKEIEEFWAERPEGSLNSDA